jgi:sulfide:quinone oxidoreductase
VGGHRAAKGAGNFLAEPAPSIAMFEPSEAFHQEKAAQESAWLTRWNA